MTFATFKNKGEQQYGEISFLTNLPEGSLDRLESLEEGYDSEKTFDPRFAVLLSQCLVGDGRSDQRQAHLFEDIFEDFDDGTLCALCLRRTEFRSIAGTPFSGRVLHAVKQRER